MRKRNPHSELLHAPSNQRLNQFSVRHHRTFSADHKDNSMNLLTHMATRVFRGSCKTSARMTMIALLTAAAINAQSPWETAVNNLQQAFTGPIAKGLSLIAIVVGGITFAYSEGGSKKIFAGIVFGIGMAISAASFMSWLFGV